MKQFDAFRLDQCSRIAVHNDAMRVLGLEQLVHEGLNYIGIADKSARVFKSLETRAACSAEVKENYTDSIAVTEAQSKLKRRA